MTDPKKDPTEHTGRTPGDKDTAHNQDKPKHDESREQQSQQGQTGQPSQKDHPPGATTKDVGQDRTGQANEVRK